MLGTQTAYPDFVPNQILTNSQLNELRQHLDGQDRITRKKLIGMGLACGFRWKLRGPQAARKVDLFEGLGLTSDGYVVCICEKTVFTHVRRYTDPGLDDNGTTPLYTPWRTSATGIQRHIMELVAVPPGAPAPDDVRVLRQADIVDRVFVLYVELEPVELRSCFVTECDNKGKKVNVNLRALAVKERHLDEVTPCAGPLGFFHVPRLHTVVPLEQVSRASHINQGYRAIVRRTVPRLVDEIGKAFEKYSEFLDLDADHFAVVEDHFARTVADASPITQSQYDAVKVMATAYNEFVEAACELVLYCCPPNDFPRHVMLGAFESGPKEYRHRFYPSAVRNVVDGDIERVRKLFLRIAAIAKAVKFENVSTVRVTPSQWEGVPLGARAIPYYLEPQVVADYWQPRMCCTNDKLWSYHDHEGDAGPHDHQQDKTDLAFNDYNRSSLIRIEGHLHDRCSEAHRAIIDERHLHNAEFDVLMTNFENPVPQLDDVTNRLMALLADRQKAADAYNHVVALGVANRRFPQAELRSIRDEIERLETEIRRRVGEWVLLRGRRQLHCDISHLQTIYVDLRAELICLWGGLVVELDKISDEIRAVDGALPHGRGELAAEILELLRQQVRWLADVWLPRRLSGFNYPVFVHRYKGLIHDLTRFWLLWRSFGFQVGDPAEEGHEIPTPWPPGAEAISSVLLSITRGCFHTRLARPFFAFKKLWEEDPSFFPNLAKSVDGLEHIAGVRRCGTFVVVCDQTAGQRIVRADFSLSCRLPCCCDADIASCACPPSRWPATAS